MAYTIPTVADFFIRFPSLEPGTDEDVLQALLNEASNYVDNSWREVDFAPAILYLVAHWLTSEASADQAGVIKSETFGPISVTYGDRSTGNVALSATHYGQRFMEIRKGNFPGILVV